jgi:transcriptional regulator with XRE-family HTH domain
MKKKAKKQTKVYQLRKKLGFTQTEFWSRVAVTQSGGSRYEAGRAIPKPVQMLLTIAYGVGLQPTKVWHKLRNDGRLFSAGI